MAEHRPAEHQPDIESLSAWLDGELDESARRRLEMHLADCPACAAQLAALRDLAAAFDVLRVDAPGFDLSGLVEDKLAASARRLSPAARRQPDQPAGWFGRLAWLPAGLAAAASLALGIGMGAALPGDRADAEPPMLVSAMRVFDPMPPGSLCIGSDACYTKEIAE